MSDHFTSSDEDLEELFDLVEEPKNTGYLEGIVPQYNDTLYTEHFRISREVTERIADKFGSSEYFKRQEGDSQKITALKFITVFLWFAGNEATSFRNVAEKFNITKSSLFKIIRRVTYFLSNLSREIIVWPTTAEKMEIERHFRQNHFPGVIGIIGGSHIRIDKPSEDPDSYWNSKQFHSIQAQIVCDHKQKIRDIFVGFPGSVSESRVLRESPLYETLQEKCQDFFILGGSKYPCLKNVLTPFEDQDQLTTRQKNYNYLLSKNRCTIEHCIGKLKQKFRQLHHTKLRKISDIVHFIRACAVLHNISIDDNFTVKTEELPLNDEAFEVDDDEDFQGDEDGSEKRNYVMNNLPMKLFH